MTEFGMNYSRSDLSVYRCNYCGKIALLKEFLEIDRQLQALSIEDAEIVLDKVGFGLRITEIPYIHPTEFGYPVLNICRQCWDRFKQILI